MLKALGSVLPPFKRPCQYNFTHFWYTFFKIYFLLNFTNFELKLHGEPIQLDFWAQKGGFRGLWIFFWKIIDFQAKTKKKFLLILFASECPETCPGHKFMLFLPHKPIQGVKMAKIGHLQCEFMSQTSFGTFRGKKY